MLVPSPLSRLLLSPRSTKRRTALFRPLPTSEKRTRSKSTTYRAWRHHFIHPPSRLHPIPWALRPRYNRSGLAPCSSVATSLAALLAMPRPPKSDDTRRGEGIHRPKHSGPAPEVLLLGAAGKLVCS